MLLMFWSGSAADPWPTVIDNPDPPGIGIDTRLPVPPFTGVTVRLVP
jgi:hypothetical protein